jgi:hypothetical protein
MFLLLGLAFQMSAQIFGFVTPKPLMWANLHWFPTKYSPHQSKELH